MSRKPGTRIGPYALERKIDESGRAEVWLARDTDLDRNVALKILEASGVDSASDQEEMFERQARTTARIEHPGVVAVLRAGRQRDAVYLAMRFVNGPSLVAWIPRSSREPEEARFRVLEQVASALDHAHEMGISHGALDATRIIIDEASEPKRGLLLPFEGHAPDEALAADRIAQDRRAFRSIVDRVFNLDSSKVPDRPNATCVEVLRAALKQSAADDSQTPPTVVRTRRTRRGRRRIVVGISSAVSVLIALIAIAGFALDVRNLVSDPAPPPVSSTNVAVPSTGGAQTPDDPGTGDAVGGPSRVLILGDGFTSSVGNWGEKDRRGAWRFKKGLSAADVVETALATITATVGTTVETTPLNIKNPAKCNAAVSAALERAEHEAIVVLESPCGDAVLRQVAARDGTLPPVYWLDRGAETKSDLLPIAVAPLANARSGGDDRAVRAIEQQLGDWTGQSIARLLPGETYSDVGRFAKREFNATKPCFYLHTTPDSPYPEEVLRVAHSKFEIAHGFKVETADVPARAIWNEVTLPANGSVLGSLADDETLLSEIAEAEPECILVELVPYLDVSDLRWQKRLLDLLRSEFPTTPLVSTGETNEVFSWQAVYSGPTPTPRQVALWNDIVETSNLFLLSSAPYTGPGSPLGSHLWDLIDTSFAPINFDEDRWWWSDHYALALVAQLIARQDRDPETGAPIFGKIPTGDWSAFEVNYLEMRRPVELDPAERIYGGYVVEVFKEGRFFDAFYGGYGG